MHRRLAVLGLVALPFGLTACRDSPAAPEPVTVPAPAFAMKATLPALPPAGDFVAVITNGWYPLVPGTVFTYEGETDEGMETIVVEVTHDTRVILGITATVVHDQAFLDGDLIEDTFDWYAQDGDGTIWYLGEDSCEIEDDVCVSTEGSWEAGVDGALPGILMWGAPGEHVGETYRQEFYADEAEDMAKVLRLSTRVTVPYGEFEGCLETMDFTPLDPGAREHKVYCFGTGLVLELSPRDGRRRVELVDIQDPG